MTRIDPSTAPDHRSATVSDASDPEIIDGRAVQGEAIFSPCRTWRYRLLRRWASGEGAVLWIMLNPSTADAQRVDPTVRRSVTFSMRWGFAECWVGNTNALRATSPAHLRSHPDPVGPDNDHHLVSMAAAARRIVVAWGNHAVLGGRCRQVAQLLQPHLDRCVHLGLTSSGMPRHPLYLAQTTEPASARDALMLMAAA